MKMEPVIGGLYQPLSEEQINAIHKASLAILEKTGIGYEPGLADIVEKLERAGMEVERHSSRIRFPREKTMELISRTPARVILYSRDGNNDLDLGEHRVHLGTGGAAIQVLDPETGEARPSTLKDIHNIGRLVNQLDNIQFFLRPCIPTDIPPSLYDVNVFYAALKATHKHVMAGVNDEKGLHDVMELAALVASGRKELQEKPFISVITSFVISPLKLDTAVTRIMEEAV